MRYPSRQSALQASLIQYQERYILRLFSFSSPATNLRCRPFAGPGEDRQTTLSGYVTDRRRPDALLISHEFQEPRPPARSVDHPWGRLLEATPFARAWFWKYRTHPGFSYQCQRHACGNLVGRILSRRVSCKNHWIMTDRPAQDTDPGMPVPPAIPDKSPLNPSLEKGE